MQTAQILSPRHVEAQGTVNIKHSYEDLAAHICAVKKWERVVDGPNAGAIVSTAARSPQGRIVAESFGSLVDRARSDGWIRDKGTGSRHIYWELIPAGW